MGQRDWGDERVRMRWISQDGVPSPLFHLSSSLLFFFIDICLNLAIKDLNTRDRTFHHPGLATLAYDTVISYNATLKHIIMCVKLTFSLFYFYIYLKLFVCFLLSVLCSVEIFHNDRLKETLTNDLLIKNKTVLFIHLLLHSKSCCMYIVPFFTV